MNKKKVVLITGASSGLGVDFAEQLAMEGNNLLLVARRKDRIEALAEKLTEEYGVTVYTSVQDLSKRDSAEIIYEFAEEKGLIVETLINNAGTQVYGKYYETEQKKERDLIQINLVTLTDLTKLFSKNMVMRKSGTILNVGSTGSFAPGSYDAVYQATKAYVLSFSEGINIDLKGTGVSVTAFCPGAMKTEFSGKADIDDTFLFRYTAMTSSKCAEIALRGMKKRRAVVVPGIFNTLLVISIRFTPRSVVLFFGGLLMKKMNKSNI